MVLHKGRSTPLFAWPKAQAYVWLAPTWAAGLLCSVLGCCAAIKQVSCTASHWLHHASLVRGLPAVGLRPLLLVCVHQVATAGSAAVQLASLWQMWRCHHPATAAAVPPSPCHSHILHNALARRRVHLYIINSPAWTQAAAGSV